ncbi:MAG: hypothetical protein AUK37_02175 [Rhodobacterales bacterium CG2_30_65_12]|nr:MAG: hypothetical protein AUK37_02175 [Rhodobacterales bacterium CG2_30_65_12]
MRLVCPNCGAQYEVDDRVIPQGGRDVQCSACGHGWYQMPAGHQDEAADEEPLVDEDLTDDGADAEADEPKELAPEDDLAAADAPEKDKAEDDEAEDDEPDKDEAGGDESAAMPAGAARPREIDDGIRSILQEEAQRELEARANAPKPAPEPVETQPDLGLDAGPSPDEERRRIARERMARMRGVDEDDLPEPDFDAHAEPAEPPAQPVQGRNPFPNIEEINSTLDGHAPGAATGTAHTAMAAGRSRGFSRGFVLVLLLAALAFALYVQAPKLAQSVPALEPVLTGYVEVVNSARIWLDETLRGMIDKIEAAAGEGR